MRECPEGNEEPKKEAQLSLVQQAEVFVTKILPDAVVHYWPMLLAGALFVVMQWVFPFVDWWHTWEKPNSYYSHGPLVPLIALFIVWANRKRLALIKVQPSWLGLLLIVPSIPMFMFGRWTGSGNVCAITFLTFLIGAVLMFTGLRMTRLLLFPMLYLVFMVPAPSTVLDKITFPVEIQSTTLAAKIMTVTGNIVDQDSGWQIKQGGNIIASPSLPHGPNETDGKLTVAGACSGFRMLISLLTFTAFFVYMLRGPAWKKAFLVLVSFPLSLFVNGLRIATIGFVGIGTQSEQAMMRFHDSWAMVFELFLSFAILFGLARLINARDIGIPEPEVDPAAAAMADDTPRYKQIGRGLRGPAVIALFCFVVLMNVLIRPLECTARGSLVHANFAKTFGNWAGEDIPLDKYVKDELKTGDIIQRVYHNSMDDTQGAVAFIEAAKDTDAFHDPHSCLPGGGNSIDEDKPVTLHFTEPRPMTVTASYLRSSNKDTSDDDYLLIYWYATENESYPSTSQVRLKMREAQIRDLKAIAKSWLGSGDRREIESKMAKRQTYLYRFETPANFEDSPVAMKRLESFIREFVANSPQFRQAKE